jgi:hypothetical protein
LMNSGRQCCATSAAIKSRILPVFRHKKLFVALIAEFFVFQPGACHATHT